MATTETLIQITEKAAAEVIRLRDGSDETKGKPLRVVAEPGGCGGFHHGMGFDDKNDDDTVVSLRGVDLIVDPLSRDNLKGATIDFIDGPHGNGFKIDNPNAPARGESGCSGCGGH